MPVGGLSLSVQDLLALWFDEVHAKGLSEMAGTLLGISDVSLFSIGRFEVEMVLWEVKDSSSMASKFISLIVIVLSVYKWLVFLRMIRLLCLLVAILGFFEKVMKGWLMEQIFVTLIESLSVVLKVSWIMLKCACNGWVEN